MYQQLVHLRTPFRWLRSVLETSEIANRALTRTIEVILAPNCAGNRTIKDMN